MLNAVDRIGVLTHTAHRVEILHAKVGLVAEHRFQERSSPELLAGLGERACIFEPLCNRIQADLGTGVRLKHVTHDFRLPFVDGHPGWRGGSLPMVVVPEGVDPTAEKLALQEPELLAARDTLNDLGTFEFGHGAKNGERELVFGIFLVILAVDDELLSVLENFFDDDRLDRHLARDAVSVEKVDRTSQRLKNMRRTRPRLRSVRIPLRPTAFLQSSIFPP